MNDSSTGGYLSPAASPSPAEGDALQDFFHDLIAGITGLANTLVFPAWQVEPANIPSTDWAGFRFTSRVPNQAPYTEHDGTGNGSSTIAKWEEIDLMVSFYGTNADSYAGIFADGLMIEQNRAVMFSSGVSLITLGKALQVPSLVKERWLYRVDFDARFTRQIQRTYPILNVQQVDFSLDNETNTLNATV